MTVTTVGSTAVSFFGNDVADVAFIVGATVGVAVGVAVGSLVLIDGLSVGERVGGSDVGLLVGSAVGNLSNVRITWSTTRFVKAQTRELYSNSSAFITSLSMDGTTERWALSPTQHLLLSAKMSSKLYREHRQASK